MYKVTLYERIKYPNDGQVLLDTSSGDNPGVTEVKYEGKLNEAGSFTFSVIPSHPLYDDIEPLYTYIKVEEDGEEIFYGRVLMEKTNRITGVKQYTCEGALAFLLDIEMGEDSEESTYTASEYFQHCLSLYNQKIADDGYLNQDLARGLMLGTINVSEASTSGTYKNGSRTQIQSVMKSKLLNIYDGFFHVRSSGTSHYLDWITQVGVTDPQPIKIKQNVISHTATKSGEDIFSELWPKGNSTSSGGSVTVDPMSLSTQMVRKYGVIMRTVNFDANDEASLRSKAQTHINKIQDRLSLNGEINFVDMSYLDGTHPKVHLGDVFTQIDGFEGTKLTAATVSKDLLNPKNDKLSLKTDKDLMSSSGINGTNSSSSNSSSGSGGGRGLSGSGSKWYKFIHETEEDLSLAARNIEITADEKIRLVSQRVETQAEQISTLSTDMGTVKGKWTEFEGTGLYQNRESITTVAGKFRTDSYGRLVLVEGAQFVVSGDGTDTNVGKLLVLDDNTVRDVGQLVAHYQGSYSYQHDDEIAGIVGRYTVETYVDPQNPWKEITPASDANPKALGYYEKNSSGNYVQTNDETVVSGKTYYIPNDIKKVTFDSGGGYKIKENGVEYGVYTKTGDSTELTGGIIVDKLNDGTTTTKIKGTRVVLGEDLTGDDLSDWAADAEGGTGVFAKYLTVKQLTAQELNTLLANIADAEISELTIENDVHVGGQVDTTSLTVDTAVAESLTINEEDGLMINNHVVYIADITRSDNGQVLTVTKTDGSSFDFSKATTLRSGGWSGSGHIFTVEATPQGNTYTIGLDNGTSSNTNLVTGVGDLSVSFTGSTPYLSIPITVTQVYSGEGDDDDLRYTRTPIVKNVGDLLENLTGTKKITQNGTISLTSLPEGKMGYGNIEINVPIKVSYRSAMPYDGDTIKAVVAGTTGSDFLQVISVDYGLSGSGSAGSRELLFKIGDNEIYHQTLTDYGDGYTAGFDAVVDPYFEKWDTTDVETDLANNTIWFQTSKKSNNTTARHGSRSVYLTGGTDWTGSSTKTTRVYLRDGSASGDVIGMKTITAPASSGITGLEVDTTNHQIKTSTSETTQSVTISVEKASMAYVESTHKYAYVFSAYAGSSVVASSSGTTDTDAYDAGFDDVSSPTFSSWRSSSSSEPSSDVISNTVTFEVDDTTGGTARTGSRQVNLTKSGTWSSGSTQVYLRDNGTSGNYIGRITVSLPSSATWSASVDSTTSGKEYKQYNVYCTVGGKKYGAYVLGTVASWNHGGLTAHMSYSQVDSIDGGTYKTLDMATYGQGHSYVRLLAGYVYASGNRASQSSPITVNGTTYYGKIFLKVPQFQDKTVTSNGTVYPDSGYAGLSSVTVNVPAESHSLWGYVGLYQSSITVEGETYSLYLYSQSKKNNATTRVYK